MKKFAAVILVLALTLMLTSAFAEVKNFGLAGVTDMEGNILYAVLEDDSIVDGEGNPAEFPRIAAVIDDEAMTFTMSTADQSVSGTVEVVESTDEQVALLLTPDMIDTSITAYFTTEGGNALTIVDEANGMMAILSEIEVA